MTQARLTCLFPLPTVLTLDPIPRWEFLVFGSIGSEDRTG